MSQSSHIISSGGLISTAFIENIRQAQTNQRGTQPDTYGLPWQEAPKSPAVLEAKIAETWETLLERWDAIATDLPAMDISQARDRWILPFLRALDFQPSYQRGDIVLDDSEALRFNISHFGWETSNDERGTMNDEQKTHRSSLIIHRFSAPPLHTVAPNIDLDARPDTTTARRSPKGKSPHDMLQLFLNVSREHRWAVLTNGLHLRLLRDYHHTYTKGYVEFDLESIFETRNFADFRALYRMAHASRFIGEAGPPADDTTEPSEVWESVPLEMFYRDSQAAGIQVGADLQKQVREAIETLGNGFLMSGSGFGIRDSGKDTTHEPLPPNPEPQSLLQALQQDAGLCRQFYSELLHIIYRILFLLYAEQRGMVPGSGAPLDNLYRQGYSLTALRSKAESDPASPEAYDLWEGLKVTFKMFRQGAPELGVYRYNGMLFAEDQTPLLDGIRGSGENRGSGFGIRGSGKDTNPEPQTPNHEKTNPQPLRCRNFELLRAIRALTLIEREGVLQRISYADLNVEEIGGIYESLLDFAPRVTTGAEHVEGRDLPPNTFFLDPRGTARKTTGSYYTHPSLVNALIESALVPVLEDRISEAIFGIRGSGLGVSERREERYDQSGKLPRSESLADGDEVGDRDIRGDKGVSPERTVRPDQPVAPGSGIDSGEHRRGIRSAHDEGLSELSDNSSRLSDGSGDTASNQSKSTVPQSGDTHEPADPNRTSGSLAQRAHRLAQEEVVESRDLGLGIRGSETGTNPQPPIPNPQPLDYQFLTDEQRKAAENAILSLKVCDPAMGSGHFLIAANNALALRLAQIRTGDEYPAEQALRRARRDVLAHCIYGVDLNPMAVELCKVALWINAAVDNAPLSFLDHHLKCGNSLIGATPDLLEKGIPDDAFRPVTGDNKKVAAAIRKRNKKEREGQLSLWRMTMIETEADLRKWRELNDLAEDQPQIAERRYTEYRAGPAYRNAKLVADLWTAAFFWPLTAGGSGLGIRGSGKDTNPEPQTPNHEKTNPEPLTTNPDFVPTEELFRQAQVDPALVPGRIKEQAAQLAEHYKFFHWHLEFPDVFQAAPEGVRDLGLGVSEQQTNPEPRTPNPKNHGFDVILGNPPWERIKLQEKEFFADRDPAVANAANAAARRRAIAALEKTNPALFAAYRAALRAADATGKFLRDSGAFPLTGRGDVNTYQVFAGLTRRLMSAYGRAGIIVPTGIATDFTNRDFFADVVDKHQLASLFDFENRRGIFPGVHRSYKFSLLTLRGAADDSTAAAQFAFFLHDVDDLSDPERTFTLTAADFARLNPNTKTCPVFRTRTDAELTKKIYQKVPVFLQEIYDSNGKIIRKISSWGCEVTRTFDMARFGKEALSLEELLINGHLMTNGRIESERSLWIPILESKTFWIFDHRYATYKDVTHNEAMKGNCRNFSDVEKLSPEAVVVARYWLKKETVSRYTTWYTNEYWIAYRNITNTTNERTMIPCILPRQSSDYTVRLIYGGKATGYLSTILVGNLGVFCFDYVARQSVAGTNFSDYIMKQLPVIPPERYTPDLLAYIVPRVLELTYTAWDLRPFADDVWWESRGSGFGIRDSGEITNPEHRTPNHQPPTPLQEAILRQWEDNRDATNGGHEGATPPDWAEYRGSGLGIGDSGKDTNPKPQTPNPEKTNPEPRTTNPEKANPEPRTPNHQFPHPPFKWDETRRAQLRADLDGLYGHLYGLTRDELAYILDTFPIVRRKDEAQYGEYRTKRMVLEAYDELQGFGIGD